MRKRFDDIEVGKFFLDLNNICIAINPVRDEVGDCWNSWNLTLQCFHYVYNEQFVSEISEKEIFKTLEEFYLAN